MKPKESKKEKRINLYAIVQKLQEKGVNAQTCKRPQLVLML
ncbi:hypothetical protein [Planomicrobium sp. CPCC 101110]|nr:hypothetical protein [Planomicrobium sp. CPCC 101110]